VVNNARARLRKHGLAHSASEHGIDFRGKRLEPGVEIQEHRAAIDHRTSNRGSHY
jgi:hypothetical protein